MDATDPSGLVAVVAVGLWAMLPAYVPNNVAVLVGGGPPIDGGRTWGGRRLLGDGKTWRGTAGGWFAGVALALALEAVRPGVTASIGVSLPDFPLAAALALPLGAMLGDFALFVAGAGTLVVAEWISLPPITSGIGGLLLICGAGLFVAGALLLSLLAAPDWFLDTFTLPVVVTVLILTPVLHVATNAIAYGLGLKDEPW